MKKMIAAISQKVMELKGKRAVVKIGLLPMQVEINELVVVKEKVSEE